MAAHPASWILTITCRVVHIGANGVQHAELVRLLIEKGTADMCRKHGAKLHMKNNSSSATIPAIQSPGPLTGKIDGEEYVKSRAALGSFDGELPTADDFLPGLTESMPGAAGMLGRVVDYNTSGDGRALLKSEPLDSKYGEVLGKRPRSRSSAGLDDAVATPAYKHKRQKDPVEDLDESASHGSQAALPTAATLQENAGVQDDINRGPMDAGHAGNTETGSGYSLNDTQSYGTSATNTVTTVTPLLDILNETNASSVNGGASPSGVGATIIGMGLANSLGQAGPSNFETKQPYLPSQVDHGVRVAVSPHNSERGVQPPEPVFIEPVAARGSDTVPSAYPALSASDNATHQPPTHIDHGNGVTQYSQSASGGFKPDHVSVTSDNPVMDQKHQQPEEVPLNTPADLIQDIEAQEFPISAALDNPNMIAHAILDGGASSIRPDQLRLVIISVAQHLGIDLPPMGPLGPVGPGIPDDLLDVSISTGARLDGPAGHFNAWEAEFLRAIIPPSVATLLSNLPDPPHGALPPRTHNISSAD